MKILVLADKPSISPIDEIMQENPGIELIILLGDLWYMDVSPLTKYTNIPIVGIYGNHCDGRYMEDLGFTNLHLRTFQINGLTVGGFEGCVKYKEAKFQYTQEQAIKMLSILPKVDMLICHCPPLGINDAKYDHAHIGFKATLEYIEKFKPKYLLHGHTYDYGNFVDKYLDTNIIYIHGAKVIEV